jgi:hypothetical protein
MSRVISEAKAYLACEYYPNIGKNFISFTVLCLSSILSCIRGMFVFVIRSFFINTCFGSAWISQCIWPHYGKKNPEDFKNVPRRGYTLIHTDIHPHIS